MGAIHYSRLAVVLLFGVIPALLLSMFAGLGLIWAVLAVFSDVPLTGLAIAVVSLLGLVGAYSICDAASGVTENWQRLGLLAGIFAASTFVFFEFSTARVSPRLEPSYWVLSPIAVAACLLLESYLTKVDEDEQTPVAE